MSSTADKMGSVRPLYPGVSEFQRNGTLFEGGNHQVAKLEAVDKNEETPKSDKESKLAITGGVRSLNIVGNGTISRSDTEVETLKAVGNAEENSKSDLANKGTEMNLVAVNKNETIPENQTGVEALSLKAEHWSIGETLHPAGESDPAGPSEQSILGEAGAVRSLEMLPNDHKKNTTNE